MAILVDGVYQHGKIELHELPNGISEGPVRVVIFENKTSPANRFLEYGKYKSSTSSTEDSFRCAEWRGDVEFDRP